MGTDFPIAGSGKYHLERLNINNVEAVSVVEERVVCGFTASCCLQSVPQSDCCRALQGGQAGPRPAHTSVREKRTSDRDTRIEYIHREQRG